MNELKALLVSGMYRSGTSLIWRILSGDSFFNNCFYEPLNYQLPKETKSLDLYKIYRDNPEILKKWSSSFHIKKFFLNKDEEFQELKKYLDLIIKQKNLIKFTRITMRLGWLINRYPDTYIINIVRDPRAVCYSYMKRGHINFNNTSIINKVKNWIQKYKPSIYWHSEYLKYLESSYEWGNFAKMLAHKPTYIKILGLWKINIEQSLRDLQKFANKKTYLTLRHEDFCTKPYETIVKIYKMLNRPVPRELMYELNNNSKKNQIIPNHKFHLSISDKWLEQWKNIDKSIWKTGIEESKISSTMNKMGYN